MSCLLDIFSFICYTFITGEVFDIARNTRIRAARAAKDMTQKALAEAVGVSRQTMNAIEQGEFNPTIRLCQAICRVLGKSLDELFGEEDTDMYCTGCQFAFHDSDRCPICGAKKVRPARPEDICFLTEADPVTGGMLKDILEQEGIPVLSVSSVGAGMAMRAGTMFERVRLFVRYDTLTKAKETAEELLHADETKGDPEE